MSELVIREVTQDVWTFSRPFVLRVLPIGGRSTAIRLQSGDVWVFVSTPLTDETKHKLEELGAVKYLIAPNSFHNLFIRQFKEAYPSAKVIGPADLALKPELAGITIDIAFSAENPTPECGFEDEIETCYFSGYSNHDLAFYHKASKTVIAADLLFNVPSHEQFSKSSQSPKSLLFAAMHPRGWQMRWFIWLKQQDKEAMRREAKKVDSWDFDRFIVCHGDVIETNAKAAWRSAWVSYLS